MKDRIDFPVVGALLRKQFHERTFTFTKGNFDPLGFLFKILIVAAFVTVFVIFFGKFTDIYLALKVDNAYDKGARLFELLSFVYMLIMISMTVSAVTSLVREFFRADDVKLFSAMPVGARTLFIAKLIGIYFNQLIFAIITMFSVNFTVAMHAEVGAWFYCMTVLSVFVLPLFTIGIGSILALPFYAIVEFLKPRFVLMFIVVTILTAAGFTLYAFLLGAVKEMLLGDQLRYFFSEPVMRLIGSVTAHLYPASLLADFILKRELLISGIVLLAVFAVSIVLSMLIIRAVLIRALQSRIAGSENFMYPKREVASAGSVFSALLKKEFVQIFRTPSYMFSYFSVAVVMPLMVFFCMDVGAQLIYKVLNLNCNVELAIFLTLLFSALTNAFCSTNISREGVMFYSVKALPVSYKQVVFAKIVFCMAVAVLSQLVSAVVLAATGYIMWYVALFVFAVGVLFSFAQICFATRYDFAHARFSTEEDCEIRESGNTVSTIIALGMLLSFLIGGIVLLVRLLIALHGNGAGFYDYITYLVVSAVSLLAAGLSFFYLIRKLGEHYYEFSGGGLF